MERNDISALHFYQKWVKDGKRFCDNGYPDLGKNNSISITKGFLVSIDASCATYIKRTSYLTTKKCEKWLLELNDGTTWYT